MTRNKLYALSGLLAVLGGVLLFAGLMLLHKNIRDHLDDSYRRYATDADGARYECSGSPNQVANDIAGYAEPEARAGDATGSQYLRDSDDIVIVGPDGGHPCSVRVEDTDARYSHGSFVYLGPGFTPGSPAGGSGGSSGGPGDVK